MYTQDAQETVSFHQENDCSYPPYGDRLDAEIISTFWPSVLTVTGLVGVAYAVVHYVQQHFSKQDTPPSYTAGE